MYEDAAVVFKKTEKKNRYDQYMFRVHQNHFLQLSFFVLVVLFEIDEKHVYDDDDDK